MPTSARTFLFVPADHPRRLQRAWEAPADAVIADLEDAVAEGAKDRAREVLEAQLAAGRPRGALCVRVNPLDTPHAAADLALVARWPAIDAVVVPKARAASIRDVALGVPAIALVETAVGVLEAPAIAAAPRVERLMLGTVDLAAELGIEIEPEAAVFASARATIALASAAAGLAGPVDGVWAGIEDEAGLRAETRAARATGFVAKACIHPKQLAAVVEELAPTEGQLERARRIVAAGEAALAAGDGTVSLDGRMIDRPVLEGARRLLRQAGDAELD